MRQKEDYPEWFLWLWEKGFSLLILLGLIALLLFLVLSDSTEERLEAIEAELSEQPARAYRPPNLESLKTNEDPASLAVHEAAYVPAYSHIYYDQGRPYLLEVTLSVRNTDLASPLYLKSVRYYDTSGALKREFLEHLVELAPLQTLELLVSKQDTSGGSGANFIVEWAVESSEVDPPIIEAVMVGASGPSAISFARSSRPIQLSAAD